MLISDEKIELHLYLMEKWIHCVWIDFDFGLLENVLCFLKLHKYIDILLDIHEISTICSKPYVM